MCSVQLSHQGGGRLELSNRHCQVKVSLIPNVCEWLHVMGESHPQGELTRKLLAGGRRVG